MGAVQKYGFRIRTRNGLLVENLSVHARDRAEAERRILQIYHNCEILDCFEHTVAARGGPADVESVLGLISDTPLRDDSPAGTASPGATDGKS